MKKYIVFLLINCLTILVTAQTITTRDHRNSNTRTDSTHIVNDHRTAALVDMSSLLIKPAFEEMFVYRIQLRLKTGVGNDAGTDDPVYVQLNDSDTLFFLVKGIDNFVEGKTVTYDVLSNTVKKVKDIKYIKFGVKGNDGVCISKVELIINNGSSPIYSTEITTALGFCIDNGTTSTTGVGKIQVGSPLPATYRIAGNNLRGRNWNFDGQRKDLWRPPIKIEKEWVVSAVEASIGNQIYQQGGDLKWGTVGGRLENKTLFGNAVEATMYDGHTLKFDLDLERDISGPNPEVDVKFDLDFRCEEGKIIVGATNVNINTDGIGTIQDFVRNKSLIIISGVAYITGVFTGGVATIGSLATAPLIPLFAFSMNINPAKPELLMSCSKTLVQQNGDILLR